MNMNFFWIEVGVYALGIALILGVVAFAHFMNKPCKPCKILTVEELEEMWRA